MSQRRKRVWLVARLQEEPVWAADEDEALEIAREDVDWSWNETLGATYSATLVRSAFDLADAIPWGIPPEQEATVAELLQRQYEESEDES